MSVKGSGERHGPDPLTGPLDRRDGSTTDRLAARLVAAWHASSRRGRPRRGLARIVAARLTSSPAGPAGHDGAVRVLLVEDDARVAAALAASLNRRGYDVVRAATAAEALAAPPVDLVLLDLNLPDGDGIDLCRELRKADSHLAIIAVTARGEERDRVVGLRTGADDYVVKPFSMIELQARIDAVLRRAARAARPAQVIAVGPVRVDAGARRVWVGEREAVLTRTEFDLLLALAREPGVVISRDRLLMDVWQTTWAGGHTLEVHIGALRHKLDEPGLIQTVRGVGYRLRAE